MAPYSISFPTFLTLVLIIVSFKSGYSRSLIPIEDYDPPRASHCHNNGEHVSNTLKQGSIITDKLPLTSDHDSPTWQPIPKWQPVPMWHKIPPPPPKEE
ncbi:hypothetical protein R3W88_019304 [Solanum pinnatisectum]|uniref:Transmembrane protein n=1 Tax=Solanum pinnatisectum TaxID=50273 RepID=A0AAV9KMX2_9SOLN|nr:hypothetical protein R3W88_019304 [Solanum pinnatisectum]